MRAGTIVGIQKLSEEIRMTLENQQDYGRESTVTIHRGFDPKLGDEIWTQCGKVMITRAGEFSDKKLPMLRRDWRGQILDLTE
jgi:hypothetical protein